MTDVKLDIDRMGEALTKITFSINFNDIEKAIKVKMLYGTYNKFKKTHMEILTSNKVLLDAIDQLKKRIMSESKRLARNIKRMNVNFKSVDGYTIKPVYLRKNTPHQLSVIGMKNIKKQISCFVAINLLMGDHLYVVDTIELYGGGGHKLDNEENDDNGIFDMKAIQQFENALHGITGTIIDTTKKTSIIQETNDSYSLIKGMNYNLIGASRTLLLYGPPGTGKTNVLKYTCQELDGQVALLSVKLSSLLGRLQGDTPKNFHEYFDIASRVSPCVLFIDELDSIGTMRQGMSGGGGGGGSSSNNNNNNNTADQLVTVFAQLLDEMKGNFVVVGCTNLPKELDESVTRRFGYKIFVPDPPIKDLCKFSVKRIEPIVPEISVKLQERIISDRKNNTESDTDANIGSSYVFNTSKRKNRWEMARMANIEKSLQSRPLRDLLGIKATYLVIPSKCVKGYYNFESGENDVVKFLHVGDVTNQDRIDHTDMKKKSGGVIIVYQRLLDIVYIAQKKEKVYIFDLREGIKITKKNITFEDVIEI